MMLGSKGLLPPLIPDCSALNAGDIQRQQAGGRAIPLALSLSSRRKPDLGAEGKIKATDAA